ncbi:MAG: proton-conducting transporter membrane subunit [Bryobacteraceae bacterium]
MPSPTFFLCMCAVVAFAWHQSGNRWQPLHVSLGNWFVVEEYAFPVQLLLDGLSLPLLALTIVLSGVIGSFSSRYLHRDRGFLRFFILLHLFAFGAALTFTAGSFDLLIAGWELVGLTSVLLIAFFNERPSPVRNAARVFAVYKSTDVGLVAGVFLLHHFAGSQAVHAMFEGGRLPANQTLGWGAATIVGGLLLLAASGKAAQIPFSSWLPRAMEGPTPSSAIFYGGISVHLGIYLLLRAESILQSSPIVPAAIVLIGLLTAVQATLAGRAATDAKTSLSYAALTQLGIIFVEAGMGWTTLALLHITGHAAVRTLQFLRAPSMLHDDHRMHAAAAGQLAKTGLHYDALLPLSTRLWLPAGVDHSHMDAVLDRFFRRW